MNTSCTSACGRTADNPLQAGWAYLDITRQWRCPDCVQELHAAGSMVGQGVDAGDPLPPDFRGALPKETASTIYPPTVKP